MTGRPSAPPSREAASTTLPRVPRQVTRPPSEPGLHINEVFVSIQGEGRHIGLPTVFLRTMGCHLRCSWCDTEYAFHEGGWRALDPLVDELEATGVRRLCLTGGEPLLQRDAWTLVRRLLAEGWHVSIETSGAVVCDEAARIADEMGPEARARLSLSMDVKCPGSGEARSWKNANLALLSEHDQLKFILADEADYDYAAEWVRTHQKTLPCPVWFHPMGGLGGDRLRMIADRILADRLDVRLGIQLHKLIWGDDRGV